MRIQLSDHFTYQKLVRFVLPSVFMMIVTSVYVVIDGLFISNFVGDTPFAAINFIYPFIMVLGGVGFMLGTGGTALVSKIMGENDREKANRVFSMIILFAVILGLSLTMFGEIFVEPIAKLLGASDGMMEHCVTYGRITIAFTSAFMLQNIFQSFLAAAEKPKMGLAVTIAAGCTNAVLDALFVAVLQWGVAGAALATGIGQVLGGVIPLVYFLRKNDSLLRLTKTKLEIKPLLQACGNGASEFLTNIASSLVGMLYNFQLMKYLGEDGVSAFGVLMYVQFIFLAIEIGYSIGSAPIIGYNYGADNRTELKNVFKKSMILMGSSGVILSGLAQLLAVPLAKLFVGYDAELFDLTVYAFRIFSFSFIFSGITIYSSGFFTALNNGALSAILSFLRAVVFQVLFVLLLPALSGVDGIWCATFATEFCSFVTALTFFLAYRKRNGYA